MFRVFALGTFVAIVCGALLGTALANGQWVFAMGALILGVGTAGAVAVASPDPVPVPAPVTLGGPVVRPTIELDDEPESLEPEAPEPEPEPATPVSVPAPSPVLLPLDPDRSMPSVA